MRRMRCRVRLRRTFRTRAGLSVASSLFWVTGADGLKTRAGSVVSRSTTTVRGLESVTGGASNGLAAGFAVAPLARNGSSTKPNIILVELLYQLPMFPPDCPNQSDSAYFRCALEALSFRQLMVLN